MAYHTLRRILTCLRVIRAVRKILYHKSVPMIIQRFGSNGYLSLIYSPNSALHHISPPWIVVYADHTQIDGR